jgi:hypothetical protein
VGRLIQMPMAMPPEMKLAREKSNSIDFPVVKSCGGILTPGPPAKVVEIMAR